MGCNFSIDFPQSAEALVAGAESAIVSAGGKFEGTASEGMFSLSTPLGKVKGAYNISSHTMHVIVHDKPMLVGCNRIENEVRKYLVRQEV